MEPIQVVIADDDEGMRLIERKMISRVEGYVIAGEAATGDELISIVEAVHPQVVFLDVEMPEKTGIECGKIIQDMDPSIIMIFATAHDQYMGDAFEVYAFDYLLKPFKMERVIKTLTRVKELLNAKAVSQNDDTLAVPSIPAGEGKSRNANVGKYMLKTKDGVSFINMADILLVQREDRSTVIYTKGNGRYVTGETLGETEARLDKDIFFRCHKSYIINLNYISNITPYGRWTYIVKLEGTKQDALITHDKYEELQKMFS